MLSSVFKNWFRKTKQPGEVKPFRPHQVLTSDDQGLQYVNLHQPKEGPISFLWKDVCRVVVFKRDLFTVDCICIGFELSDGLSYEFDEEMTGYKELTSRLHDYLPGCQRWDNWFCEVAFPAFATNMIEIYVRDETAREGDVVERPL